MEIVMTIIAGTLFTSGVYLILSKTLLRIILGLSLFTHGVHIMLMSINGLKKGAAPLLDEQAASYTDPVPQALILTSIVISFSLTAFSLVLAYRTYREHGTDNIEKLRGQDHE
ncbi:Na(+)/H(+) antiporter subunit C [Paenibacillus oryzae]|jgi:multicomponent Na+:H+ antiporter subunit C|uniref:Na(+)/H(+) antiporter subunit C n=1 Tax=Paenibacillus oryzae TaxID=1844972 RepID=A0A1A5Y9S9_9BACL|nr:Na(+)/H(+) antiporter subunit C [Paenibacillus oryzae]OBR62333.1 Na(+)/H(+) antiporter subunit C [Paenibacillus oryzae]